NSTTGTSSRTRRSSADRSRSRPTSRADCRSSSAPIVDPTALTSVRRRVAQPGDAAELPSPQEPLRKFRGTHGLPDLASAGHPSRKTTGGIDSMDFLIVNFRFEGATKEAWEERATQLAPRFAAMPELLSKVWLADAESDTYGGAYLWRDRASLDAYLSGPVFAAL